MDESAQRHRGLLILLGIVVAGSSWQIASRTGQAAPAGTWREQPAPSASRPARVTTPSTPVDFVSRLGLARPGTTGSRPAGGGSTHGGPAVDRMQKPHKPMSHAALGTTAVTAQHRRRQTVASRPTAEKSPSRYEDDEPDGPVRHQPATADSGPERGRYIMPAAEPRAHWTSLEPVERGLPHPSTGHAGEPGAVDEDLFEDTGQPDDEDFDPDADLVSPVSDIQMVVLGPAVTPRGEMVTYAISVENARDVAHAPVRIVFDPDVLELVSAEEGTFFSADGTATRFLAREGNSAGLLDVSISRVPPARGADGSGVLCTVTFLARGAGSSPVVLAGSRLLDSGGRKLEFVRSDADIAVK